MYLGIDIGSLSCDAVLIDESEQVLASTVVPTGARNSESIARASEEVLRIAGISKETVKGTVSTGYGRDRVDGRLSAVTEITCHARGIRALLPETKVLIDIGGQDSKAMLLGKNGQVVDFTMNDKCAAGTGRFLEAMARALQVDIDELAQLDQGADGHVTISSMCTVFAESEVVSLIGDGKEIREIVRGLNQSIASRTSALVKRVAPDINGSAIAMSGGVARNSGVIRAISDTLGCSVLVPEKPDTIGALGAALIAKEKILKAQ
ncbi:MAG: 2-hydroxyglutaryl-CoA dehydratase [bacterium]|nr:2-hydroxyglutaryl-CoA dehydratase [bacterium]